MALVEWKTQAAAKSAGVFRNILAAVDFSQTSRRALADAIMLAADNDARLSVVHVVRSDWRYEMLENPSEVDLEQSDVDRRLRTLISEFATDRKIDSILMKCGAVAPAIAAVVAEAGADLLVMGTHGRGGLSKLALGSVAEELLRTSPCPVMTVGPRAEMSPGHEAGFHTILFATDFGEGSAKAFPLALALARKNQGKLILLHMISPMPASSSLSAYAPANAAADEVTQWEDSSRKRALQQLKQYFPSDPGLEHEPEYVAGTDFLPEGVLTAAAKFHADLIVMGANRTAAARVMAHVPWTALHAVLVNAHCPVLTVAG